MSNIANTNPMQIDATGTLVSQATELMISGVMVLPSNATWAITIKDSSGNTKFFADNTGVGSCMPPCVPFLTRGLQITTLTNCTALIYTVPG